MRLFLIFLFTQNICFAANATKLGKCAPKLAARFEIDQAMGYAGKSDEWVIVGTGSKTTRYKRTKRGYEELKDEWIKSVTNFWLPGATKKQIRALSSILDRENLSEIKILDASTGDGTFVEDLRPDVDIDGLDVALRNWQRDKDYYIEQSLTNTKLPNRKYDLIICSYGVFHYEDPWQPNLWNDSLKEIARLLKSGGHLLIINGPYAARSIPSSLNQFKLVFPAQQRMNSSLNFLLERK